MAGIIEHVLISAGGKQAEIADSRDYIEHVLISASGKQCWTNQSRVKESGTKEVKMADLPIRMLTAQF